MYERPRIAYLDGRRLRTALLAACRRAQLEKGELNRINVFPVPDGDTGTNLSLTAEAVLDGLRTLRSDRVDEVMAAAAHAALLGARGNCGMMLSLFLLGCARHLEGAARVSVGDLAEALVAGSRQLDGAVQDPVEGTILTVARETAARAAEVAAMGQRDFAVAVEAILETATESLARTPDLLPVLAEAGVVDAGAQGFVAIIKGVAGLVAEGREGVEAPTPSRGAGERSPIGAAGHSLGSGTRRYCTEILVEGPALPDEDEVRAALADGAEELLVVRSGELMKVHLHTDSPDEAVAYCRTLGTVAAHKAEDMFAQHEAALGAAAGAVRRPVGIVVDSASDLPDPVKRAHGIHTVPLLLIDGDRTLRDGVEIAPEEFYARLAEEGPLPTTSQAPPGDFMEGFRSASTEAEVIVAVLLASSLSGTIRSAESGAELLDGVDVRLVDSKAASILTGLLALKAAELAEGGAAPDEIVAEVERIRRQSGILFTVRTLDRLIASGRVPHFAGWLAGLLGVRPVLGLGGDGTVQSFGKARGTRGARQLMLDKVAAAIPPKAKRVRFGIVHAAAPEVAAEMREELATRYPGCDILTSPITPVIATHLGLGAWGIAYMLEDRPGARRPSTSHSYVAI